MILSLKSLDYTRYSNIQIASNLYILTIALPVFLNLLDFILSLFHNFSIFSPAPLLHPYLRRNPSEKK